jgi:hypothetical protein
MALHSPQAAREAAQSILSQRHFHPPPVPNPLHGVLVWVGRAISDPVGAINRLVGNAGRDLPLGVPGIWAAAGVLVVVLSALLAVRRARTKLDHAKKGPATAGGPRPAELERAAERAERDGNWEQAVRLRFRAGLLRISERERLRYPDTTPNHVLARALGSEPLEGLVGRFDEIVYGGEEATMADAEDQRRLWPGVIAEGRR